MSTIYSVAPGGLIESTFGAADGLKNFEALVVCTTGGIIGAKSPLVHFWCDNSDNNTWHRGAVVCPEVLAEAPIIQSTYRANNDHAGNFEALVLEPGNQLVHYWRDNSNSTLPWYRGAVVSGNATGPAALIQSSFAGPSLVTEVGFPFDTHPTPPGNFEALVLEENQLVHYWRDNSKTQVLGLPGEPKTLPWIRGSVLSTKATGGATFFESEFRASSSNPGNFEALVLEGRNIVHYWRDNSATGLPWHRGVTVTTDADGPASCAQGYFRGDTNHPGNFEALIPIANSTTGNLVHFWRNNSDPALPWIRGVTVNTGAFPVSLIVSRYVAPNPASLLLEKVMGWNIEALGPSFDTKYLGSSPYNALRHFWRDNSDYPALPWHIDLVTDS